MNKPDGWFPWPSTNPADYPDEALDLCGWHRQTVVPPTRKPAAIEPDIYNDEHVSALERWQDRDYDFVNRGR